MTYSESEFVTLSIQRTMLMSRIIFSSVACPALQNFSTLSHKQNDFRKNVIGHKMFFDFLYNIFFCNISCSKKNCASYDQKFDVILTVHRR